MKWPDLGDGWAEAPPVTGLPEGPEHDKMSARIRDHSRRYTHESGPQLRLEHHRLTLSHDGRGRIQLHGPVTAERVGVGLSLLLGDHGT